MNVLRSIIAAAFAGLLLLAPLTGFAATTYKVLGQVAPSATTLTTLYTVPASTSTLVSQIVVSNRSTSNRTFRVAVRPAGAGISNEHYIAYDMTVLANDSVIVPGGFTLATTDVVSVYASTTDLSFNIFGAEIS